MHIKTGTAGKEFARILAPVLYIIIYILAQQYLFATREKLCETLEMQEGSS